MKPYIADLVANEEMTSYFLISDAPIVRKSKKGTDYACLELADKSGKIDARLWEIPPGLDVNSLKKVVVKVKGQVSEWDGKLQISISQIRIVNGGDDVDMADFFEASPFDAEEMWSELMQIVGGVANGYVRQLLFDVLHENEVNFKRAPAAKSIHHCYISGLLEHSLSLCKTSLLICERYSLDKDLMVAACCLHDLSKIDELDYSMGNSYTLAGSMLGHLAMGMMRVSEAINKIEGFPPLLKIAILHMIAAHHGSLAWGSVRVPLMKEAIAFHLCDMLDSRLAICDRALKGNVDERGLTDFVRELEGPLWRGPWQEEESK